MNAQQSAVRRGCCLVRPDNAFLPRSRVKERLGELRKWLFSPKADCYPSRVGKQFQNDVQLVFLAG